MKYLTKEHLNLQLLSLLKRQRKYTYKTEGWLILEGAIKVIEVLADKMEDI